MIIFTFSREPCWCLSILECPALHRLVHFPGTSLSATIYNVQPCQLLSFLNLIQTQSQWQIEGLIKRGRGMIVHFQITREKVLCIFFIIKENLHSSLNWKEQEQNNARTFYQNISIHCIHEHRKQGTRNQGFKYQPKLLHITNIILRF